MRKVLENYGGIILFYLTIVLCIFLVNTRFNYLNNTMNQVIYNYNN